MYTDQWNENHGTLLMGFAAGIVLIGAAILAFQQSRVRKPAFPPSRMIANSPDASGTAYLSDDATGELIEWSTETATEGPTFQLKILRVSQAEGADGGGLIRIAIYSTSEHFNQPEFAQWKHSLAIEPDGDATCEVPLEGLPESFSIAVFQDINENRGLDRNVLGIPTEPYGFSNAARSPLGPPEYSQTLVDRPEPAGEIELKIW
ncbi:DUF2141 domain-containing protein [Allorhodopirellula solitaria]|uniref:DUF2141 domain-containing protein n=1 Tax=Allorhodopirellula solitaria TaxID=2527987 RepID=A0A5C5YKD9_9BACT|nr:DUF2141 domain-containing protein [Allorhodopirellula solitaria]TWT75307.1 hypothetical protein CA85_05970 [Allorhodopirellula solitaria]